ncbi:hypothetical protein SPRG_12597 [Saprolegnia parasitica CBS 223.65]|uniref:Uncharacterized protein n=1 Tax=Saprolegnia parasitica (strain CBS 223.65) TaxID=695850 RepID=A0A067BTE9_SAPPC|nr:hypothetical protein SPRG_12597 [Saprolegnia parasitica CBS 223.65]KDO21779.1 hypothetical protein SPRG_12597 [Saprolegnia parasitica CBS 223.65]|eukprot:XP_012207458.1 hypothetical protein SPRG_12597 [Saprolegnia parasitica CBS 223.65]
MAPLRLLVVGYLVLDAAALALGLVTLVARFAFWPSIFVHGDALTALSAITLVVAGVGLVLGLRLKRHGSVLPLAAVLAICSATIYGIVFLLIFRTRGHELLDHELLVNRPIPIVQNETQNPYLHQYAVSLSMPGPTPSRAIDEAYCIHEGKVFCDTLPLRVTGGGLADGNAARTSLSSLNASSTSLALEGLLVSPNLTLNAYCAMRRNAVQVIDAGIEAACAGCERIMAATSDPLHLAPALRRLCPMREGDAAFGVFCAMYMSDRVEGYQLHYAPGRWYRYHGLRSMVQMPNGCYKALAQDADRYVTPLQITAGMLAWTTTTIAIGLWQWQRRRFLLATTNADDYVLAYRSVGTPSVYRD